MPDHQLPKLETGLGGFDFITEGGLPLHRATLVTGTAGSAKTVLASQFLAEGIERFDEAGVFVTFEESVEDLRGNVASLGWDVDRWEEDGRWAFVDASAQPGEHAEFIGPFDFGALIARVEHAVATTGATRVALDSIGAVFGRFPSPATIRGELFRLIRALKGMGVTSVVTAERAEEYGPIARFGVEDFVADNVVILRNVLDAERRRRTIEVLKLRGAPHRKGEFPFTIIGGEGIVIIPLSSIELKQRSSDVRISSGNAALDEMCGGGMFQDSVVLVSGATGTGKTLLSTEFVAGGVRAGERCMIFAFEESRDQLFRNAKGWGADFAEMEEAGLLQVVSAYPETASIEEHLVSIKEAILEFGPGRVAIDSLTALERVATDRGFREFVIGLTGFLKHHGISGLLTSTSRTLLGGESVTESHISTLTDSIILLRYVEMFGEVRRGITLLKMRGSLHDKSIREYRIDGRGMQIGRPFVNVTGILHGNPSHVPTTEVARMESLFGDD